MGNSMHRNNVPDKRVYRVEELADLLGISASSAYGLVKKGYFKTVGSEQQFVYLKSPLMNG